MGRALQCLQCLITFLNGVTVEWRTYWYSTGFIVKYFKEKFDANQYWDLKGSVLILQGEI